MDLSKAFDSLNHEPLLAKCVHMALVEVPSRLHTAIFQTENEGSNLLVHIVHAAKQGVPKGSVLGPLLFNMVPSRQIHLSFFSKCRITMRKGRTLLFAYI